MFRAVRTLSPIIVKRTPLTNNARNQVITQKRFQSHDPDSLNPSVENIAKEKREFEREVKKTLQGKATSSIPEAPGWNSKIASNSESIVKAERAPDKDFKELQKETLDTVQHKKHEKHPPPESTTAHDAWGKIWNKKPKNNVEY